MTRPNSAPKGGGMFKVFVKQADGCWRIAASHSTREQAELTAYIITNRQGFVAKVML